MTRRWRMKEVFRGTVDFGYDGDDSSRDVTLYGHTSGAKAVWDASENELQITAVTGSDGLDVDGWSNLGYLTTGDSGFTGTPDVGSVRVVQNAGTGELFLAVHTGSGTVKYVQFATATTA